MQVSVNQLLSALKEAETFNLSGMSNGTAYLYHRVYIPLSTGKDVSISSLDFDAFDEEDLKILYRLYDDVLETNSCRADGIKETLQKITPVCRPVLYV